MTQRTVKVRVAVAVNGAGCWYAVGWSGESDDDQIIKAATGNVGYDPLVSVSIVTATLPIPEPAEVEAEVERG